MHYHFSPQNLQKPRKLAVRHRLRLLRLHNDLTQRQVAEALKLERSTYAYYETGKCQPSLDTLLKLADLYDVSTDYLLGRISVEAPEHPSTGR